MRAAEAHLAGDEPHQSGDVTVAHREVLSKHAALPRHHRIEVSGATQIRKVELDPTPEVRLLTNDVAVLAYTLTEEVTVGGKKLTIEAADASTWVRRNGHWLCALHTEALQGDPWGRDRQPAPAKA